MLPAYIIEHIRQREKSKSERHQQQLELPLPELPPLPRKDPEEDNRGVIVIELF